jgi:hypothetical protein
MLAVSKAFRAKIFMDVNNADVLVAAGLLFFLWQFLSI